MVESAYLGDYRAIVRTSFGRKMFVDTRDVSLAPHLLLDGKWEEWITNVIAREVPGCHFVDVGANFGWYSLLAEEHGAKSVTAYEANPYVCSLLKDTFRVNGMNTSDCFCRAVADETGEVGLEYRFENLGGGACLPLRSVPLDQVHSFKRSVVRQVVLDEHLGDFTASSDRIVFKFDIEGYEPRAVLGARELLTRCRSISFVEYHSDLEGKNKLKEMLELFESLKFQMGHVQTDSRIRTIQREELANLPEAEMLCFRKFSD